MLGLGRILAAQPRLLLADELSLGLAPAIAARLYSAVRELAAGGCAVIVVEQQVGLALTIADYAYVLSSGKIRLAGSAAQLRDRIGEIDVG
jgi:branched-chain amino acid transport system ATP-binding protein